MIVPRSLQTQTALAFRLALRRYAIPLRNTAGVQDLGEMRKIPNAPRRWYGLTEWSGRVLNVIDLPHLLGERPVESTESIVRLADPHGGIALYIPAHLGLTELNGPDEPAPGATHFALGNSPDAVHWIDVEALISECARQAAR